MLFVGQSVFYLSLLHILNFTFLLFSFFLARGYLPTLVHVINSVSTYCLVLLILAPHPRSYSRYTI